MTNAPSTHIALPAQALAKAAELDQDRTIPLTAQIAETFSNTFNAGFGNTKAGGTHTLQATTLTEIIRNEASFPFDAQETDGKIMLTFDPRKSAGATLKNLSDGATAICHDYSMRVKPNESGKLQMAMLFQAPLYQAYLAAGLKTGPHTTYYCRGC